MANQDAQQMEHAAALSGQVFEGERFRWVWVQDANPDTLSLISFVLNSVVSRSSVNYPPGKDFSPVRYVADGHLVRVDLRRLCPDEDEFLDVADTWDKLRDPRFKLDLSGEGEPESVYGPHVSQQDAANLQELTACESPLVSAPALLIDALSTIDGGLYYEFCGVPRSTDSERESGLSDFDKLLAEFGISEESVRKAEADQWVGLRISDVTAKPRRIVFYDRPAPTGKIQGWISITYDTFDDNTDPESHPIMSLLEFKHDGTEVIIERNTGHLLYLLYDGEGNLADEAPPNLVSDTTIPDPHTKRLQAAISCIRCHGGQNEAGWKDFSNDIPKLVNFGGMDIVADATATKLGLGREEAMELLARLYQNDMQKPLRRAREDQNEAVLISTFGSTGEDGLPWGYHDVAQGLKTAWEREFFNPVRPVDACRDLGYETDSEETAILLLNALLGRLVEMVPGFAPEDVNLGSLKAGLAISRKDWNRSYVDAAARAAANREILAELMKRANQQSGQPAESP